MGRLGENRFLAEANKRVSKEAQLWGLHRRAATHLSPKELIRQSGSENTCKCTTEKTTVANDSQ